MDAAAITKTAMPAIINGKILLFCAGIVISADALMGAGAVEGAVGGVPAAAGLLSVNVISTVSLVKPAVSVCSPSSYFSSCAAVIVKMVLPSLAE